MDCFKTLEFTDGTDGKFSHRFIGNYFIILSCNNFIFSKFVAFVSINL